jgi:predicted membrane protein
LILGFILLADNLGYLSPFTKSLIFSWQTIIIAIGFYHFVDRKTMLSGSIIMAIGFIFILPDLYKLSFDVKQVIFPVIIIIIGLFLIFKNHHTFKYQDDVSVTEKESGYFEDVAIFGGGKHKVVSDDFKGGKILAFFGGSEIDLSGTQLKPGFKEIRMICVFGGTSLTVPDDWNIHFRIASILGGFADKRKPVSTNINSDKEIFIKGVCIFGGGEIKSC